MKLKDKSMKAVADVDGLKKTSTQKKPPPSKASNESTDYMKSTGSSHERKDKLQVITTNASASISRLKSMNSGQNQISSKPVSSSPASVGTCVRNLSLKPSNPSLKKNSRRATCSSTIKGTKFPGRDESNGASNMKVCTYPYCSQHGQKKQASQSMEALSAVQNKGPAEDDAHSRTQKDETEFVDIARGITGMMLQESFSVTSFEDYSDNRSEVSLEELQASDESVQYTAEYQESANASLLSRTELSKSPKGSVEARQVQNSKQEQEVKANVGNVVNSASFFSENPLEELTNKPKAEYSIMRRQQQPRENQENAGELRRRPLRFLPLKPVPESEKVRLRPPAVEERKAAEEWMIDYALRKAVGRMAPAMKRKVALLVAAFESVTNCHSA